MNEHREDKSCCYFHPKEAITGVCHWCLNERLLILAAEHAHHRRQLISQSQPNYRSHSLKQYRKPQIKLPKIFAFGNSIFNRFEFHRNNLHYSDGDDASASPDQDSFISIKFEDNGVASWEKGNNVSKVSLDHCNISWNNHKKSKETNSKEGKSVIKLAEPRGSSLRWRKRIGHVFQLIRWKRSSSSKGSGHSNKMEGVKVRSNGNGWIRSLTKRRTKE